MHKKAKFEFHSSASVRYQTRILNADGTVAKTREFKRNLILDSGLNALAASNWINMFQYCAVGTGTDPVKRDSAAVTFSRAGTAVSSSANFFEAADVGRLLKFDSGEEMYCTAFTDAQNITVNLSGTIAASPGTMWYVNRTALQTETARTNNTTGGGAFNLSTFVTDTWTHQRQFLFGAVGGAVTYREIGWSPGANPTALFGMDIIPGGGDSLLTGQQYQVIVTLIVKYGPNGIQAQSNVGSGGFDTSGTWAWQYIGAGAVAVIGAGAFGPMDPGGDGFNQRVVLLNQSITLLAAMTDSGGAPGSASGYGAGTGRSVYTSGDFFVDINGGFGVTEAVDAALTGITWGCLNAGGSSPALLQPMPLVVKFTTPQAKDNLHTLSVSLRLSWGRDLVN